MLQINRAIKGIVSDIDNTYVSPENWVFPTHGIRVFNRDGQGFVVSNQKGNEEVFEVTEGFTIIAAEEHRGIIYLISVSDDEDPLTEIGCYPYPNAWLDGTDGFSDVYSVLKNYSEDASRLMHTTNFKFNLTSKIKLIIDDAFDESANLYICDGVNIDKVINVGFTIKGVLNGIEYNDNDFQGKMNHILYSLKPPVVGTMTVLEGGGLRPGNYSIFFSYKTSTYDQTEFFTGPQNIFIGEGTTLIDSAGMLDKDLDGNQNFIDKKIQITLSKYDESYKFITVGIIRYFNDDNNNLIWEEYALAENYKLSPDLKIVIQGNEEETFFSEGELFKRYIAERISTDHIFEESRMWKVNLSRKGYDEAPLRHAALLVTINSVRGIAVTTPRYNQIQQGNELDQMLYQDPNTIYERTGYFEAEIYPFCLTYLMRDGTLTAGYPVTGTNGNVKGLHKFQWINELVDIYSDPDALKYTMIPQFVFDDFFDYVKDNPDLFNNVVGVYIMRSNRLENMLYDGMWTRTAKGVAFAKNRAHSDSQASNVSGCTSGARSQVTYRNATKMYFGAEDVESNALHIPVFRNQGAAKKENQYSFPIAAWTNNHPIDAAELQSDEPDRWEYTRAVPVPWKNFEDFETVGHFNDMNLWNRTGGYEEEDAIDYQLFLSDNKFALISPDFAIEDRHSIVSGQTVWMQVYTETDPDIDDAIVRGHRPQGAFRSHHQFGRVNDYEHKATSVFNQWFKVKVFPVNKGVHAGPGRFSSYAEDGYGYKGKGTKGYFELDGYYGMGMKGSWIGLGNADSKMKFKNYNRSYQSPPYIGIEIDDEDIDRFNFYFGGLDKDFLVRLYKEKAIDASHFVNTHGNFLPEYTKYWAVSDLINLVPKTGDIPVSEHRTFAVYKGDNFKSKVWLRGSHHVDYDENASKVTNGIRIWGRDDLNALAKEYACEAFSAVFCEATYMHGCLLGFLSSNKYNVSYRAESIGEGPDGKQIRYSFYPKVSGERDAMQWINDSSNNEDLIESLIVPAGVQLNRNRIEAVGDDVEEPVDDYRKGTRVVFSDRRVAEAFADGYRVIKSSSFQDYSTNYGHIQRVISLYGKIITVREKAITLHAYGENKLSDLESQIIAVPASIYLTQDEPEIAYHGIQQFHALLETRDFAYGIDERNKTLWRIGIERSSTGKQFPKFVNMTEQFGVINEVDKVFESVGPLTGTPIVGPGCVIGYNSGYREVYFSFINSNNKYTTILFNERISAFTGTSPLGASVYIEKGVNVLTSLHYESRNPQSKVYLADRDQEIIRFYGEQQECKYSFIINGAKEEESAALLEKIFSALRINSPKFELNSIDYETERQKGHYIFVTNDPMIYKNAEYIENDWNIPIIRDEQDSDEIYQLDSEFRGRWLKVTLNYTGVDSFYIRSVLSEFDLSFA